MHWKNKGIRDHTICHNPLLTFDQLQQYCNFFSVTQTSLIYLNLDFIWIYSFQNFSLTLLKRKAAGMKHRLTWSIRSTWRRSIWAGHAHWSPQVKIKSVHLITTMATTYCNIGALVNNQTWLLDEQLSLLLPQTKSNADLSPFRRVSLSLKGTATLLHTNNANNTRTHYQQTVQHIQERYTILEWWQGVLAHYNDKNRTVWVNLKVKVWIPELCMSCTEVWVFVAVLDTLLTAVSESTVSGQPHGPRPRWRAAERQQHSSRRWLWLGRPVQRSSSPIQRPLISTTSLRLRDVHETAN